MLIVCPPKTASTSLLKTLLRITGKESNFDANEGFEREVPLSYRAIGVSYGSCREFTKPDFDLINDPDTINCLHIPPTINNLVGLNVQVCLLTRSTNDIWESMRRAEEKGIQDFGDNRLRMELYEQQFKEQVEDFQQKWLLYNNSSCIPFERLINDPKEVLPIILDSLGVQYGEQDLWLEKEKYSGN